MGQGHTSLPPLRGASAPTPAGVWAVRLGCKAGLPEPPVLGSGVLISLVLSNLNWIKNNSVWVGEGSAALLLLFLLGMFLRRVLSAGGKPPVPQLQPTVLLPVSVGQDVPLDPLTAHPVVISSAPQILLVSKKGSPASLTLGSRWERAEAEPAFVLRQFLGSNKVAVLVTFAHPASDCSFGLGE